MVTDQRQQELFLTWFSSEPGEFAKWLERQPDRAELTRVISYYWAYSSKQDRDAVMVRTKMNHLIRS